MRSPLSMAFSALAKAGIVNKNAVLHLAAQKGYTSMAAAILESGANVHSCDDAPLRLAVLSGRMETARFLMENGADPHANNDEPLRMAEQNKNAAMENLLRNCPKRSPL
jgi:ankyrin repeat protein